ncbi:PRC-barrel domain containing protein [Candidatus Falkowbacteria bacterium]|uniref:PRC-barrel domain-containing protein n=1 Tax=Candidatus Buchananbacteria bacterium CG10_big_fil_rev_8_21_14_0_10_33_19 TaxID=1974525 RepID=A0A2H0W5D2_9BACT|nr:PRC-barrel domain containing protein [Candidatus Falkowbacteria bacterium]PIS06544.1 MAG: hypothetical protein COT80_00285 [Candidatus Buchananbacteria bacterium CG10_big_fil_rev_8_21_14_0_10_33_19]
MILTSDQLIGLKVVTKSGQILGKIKDFEFNTENSKITKYIVVSNDLVKKITAKNLVISINQIIEITIKKMIVDDNVVIDVDRVNQVVIA